jgi:signal transduction histidine kinase
MIEKLGIMQPVFQVYGSPVLVEGDKSVIIFRIVQEALHNVIKHSKATLVEMNIHYSPENVKLTVKDNGTGFGGPDRVDGSGLRNMRARARVIGADFSIDSTEARGTLITLTIPQS